MAKKQRQMPIRFVAEYPKMQVHPKIVAKSLAIYILEWYNMGNLERGVFP